MLSCSSPLFSPFGWPFEDSISISHEHYNFSTEIETNSEESFLRSPFLPPLSQPVVEINGKFKHSNEVEVDDIATAAATTTTMEKKLNHNASERDRRKKINDLYSSLRSLLPAADQTKKLSIPATISRVVKYVPDLQREVERLVQKKEELMSRIHKSRELLLEDLVLHVERKRKRGNPPSSLSVVSATPVGDREVVIQICTTKINKGLLSKILVNLEEQGLILLNASCLESFGDKVFYNLHLQVQGAKRLEFEMLRERILSFV